MLAKIPFILLAGSDCITSNKFYRQVSTYIQHCPEGAQDDYDVLLLFIKQYSFSQDTYNSYRRDVERFILWLWLIQKSTLSDASSDMISSYIQFFKSPPKSWIQAHRQSRLNADDTLNTNWRPFMASSQQVSAHTLKSMLAILRTFFQFCLEEGVLARNPVASLKQKRQHLSSSQENTIMRRMNAQQWQTVIGIAMRDKDSGVEAMRGLFVMSLFYLLGVRISEISATERHTPTMGDFYQDSDLQWWFRALGKGNKQRDIAVADELLDILSMYRHSHGLSAQPALNEGTPLVMKMKGSGGCGIRQIRNILSQRFDRAVAEMRSQGHEQLASHLAQATAHWLRHTAISEDVASRPLEHVRDDAGHSNIRITSHYITTDRAQRHRSAKDKKLIRSKNDVT